MNKKQHKNREPIKDQEKLDDLIELLRSVYDRMRQDGTLQELSDQLAKEHEREEAARRASKKQ
ncbi:MAG: hypothetical protein AAB388_00195 [Patescibacteria group bacterium]